MIYRAYWDLDYNQQHFYSKRLFVYRICIIHIGLGKPKVCVNLFGIGKAIKLLFKGGGKRKTLNLTLTLCFLYAFGFCNQAKSLTPTLKILLVPLCEAAANQLQQSKGCCGISHLLGFVQRSKPCTGIRALNWLVTYWEPCIKRRNCHYRTSPIGYWGKCSTIGWYKVLGFLYL